MATAPNANPLPPFAHKLLRLIAKLVANKAHAQINITIRDGKVQLINVQQSFMPDNLPD
jgi:hypothetical protein